MSPANPANCPANSASSVLAELVDHLTAQVQAGQPIAWDEVARQHPEHVDELRRLWPALGALDDLSHSGHDELSGLGPTAGGDGLQTGVLGDFRIGRKVGWGAMGVVYEAEQISLGRRVALKVLTLAATLDPRLQRFKNEALAAAQLDHPHIVGVQGVGCERGVHYYAMRLIDGPSLAAVIAQLRRRQQHGAALPDSVAATIDPGSLADLDLASAPTGPTEAYAPAGEDRAAAAAETAPRLQAGASTRQSSFPPAYFCSVAELVQHAAEALHHAHEHSIIHRDIKPSNLLLDSRGKVWVADFGLAHVQGDKSLTQTGELVGTLRYMSPEQALAKRVLIDHRSDVYSLGATLYELLTLRPVFGGNDRQELLRQIAFEEPVQPRRINKAVPPELETIVLKALEKNPAERYATAEELAKDLGNWLEDKPIQARRPTWRQMAAKWARRHRPAVRAAMALFLVLAVVGTWLGFWWMQKQAFAEGEARAALKEAAALQKEEKWIEAQSAVKRAQGVLVGVGADGDLQQEVDELAKDLEMARRLEEARLKTGIIFGQSNGKERNLAYAEAFKWYGLSVDSAYPHEVAVRIRSRSIRLQLVAALDDWAYGCNRQGVAGSGQLLAIARAADPDYWRNRLRHALEGKDPRALQEDSMGSIHLIRFPDRETRTRAIRGFYKVRVTRVRFPGDVMGVTDEHISALTKAKIPFIYVSKKPSRKTKHAPAVRS